MKKHILISSLPILILILILILIPIRANAQETLWEANGVPIRQGVHIEWQRTVCPGDNGSAIFVWSDTRNGSRNVFAQKVNSNGNFLWGTDGAAVIDLPGRQEDPVAIADGSGGAFVAWVDYRFEEEGDIFIQHVDNNGNRLMDDGGESLARVDGRHLTINMCTDSSGGVFVTWQDKRNLLDDDIYGTHVSESHDIVSPGTGVAIIEMNGNQGAKSLEYAGNGQATLLWTDTRSGAGNDIYGQKINMDMSKVFAEEGLPIAVTSELETKPRTTYMSNDTSFVIWQSGTESSDIYFNFLTSNGLVFSDPQVVSTFNSNKKGPRVKRNDAGDVFVQWIDYRADTTNGNHYYQKITNGGVRAWSDDGVQLDSDGDDHHARFVGNASGGAHIFWERGTYPDVDIIYQNIQSDGSLGQTTPIYVSDAIGYQSMPIAVYDYSYGAYVIFADQENGSIDIRTQRIAGGQTIFEDNGILAMEGLDGDVNYVSSFYTGGLDEEVILNWIDNRNKKKLYGSIVDADGVNDSWQDGVQLAGYEILIEELENEPVSFFQNGTHFITANFDGSTGAKLIRLNRYDTAFNTTWGDSGIYVYESIAEQRRIHILPLLNGNNFCVFWSEIRDEFEYDIFMQVFNQNGESFLQDGGVRIVDGYEVDNYVEAVVATPSGEIMIFWVEDLWGDGTLKYNFITSSGTVGTNGITGGYTLSNSGDPENLVLAEFSFGESAIVAWEELHNFSKDVYANKINEDGSLASSSNVAITSADNDQSKIKIISGASNRALIVWEDFENGIDFNITGQIVSSELDFIGENINICHEDLYQGSPALAYDGDGRFLVAWEDERGVDNGDPALSGGLDIYVQIVTENGLVYQEGGVVIASEYHDQSSPQFQTLYMNDNNNPAWMLHWVDMRSSGKADLKNLYAQGIEIVDSGIDDNIIPSKFSVSSAFPNPFNGRVALDISIAEIQPISFMITNVLGQVVYQNTLLPTRAGKFQISWNGKDLMQKELPSGIYLYSVKTNKYITSGKFTYLK